MTTQSALIGASSLVCHGLWLIQLWLTCGQNSMYFVAQYDGGSLQVQSVEHGCSGLGWQPLTWPRFHKIHQLQRVVRAIQTGRPHDLKHTRVRAYVICGKDKQTVYTNVFECTCTLLLPILVALLHRRLLTPIPSPSPTSSAIRLSILAWKVLSFTRWSNTPNNTRTNAQIHKNWSSIRNMHEVLNYNIHKLQTSINPPAIF